MIELDGAHGEGGGQILRTALALSCCLGKAFHITRIRANRAKPGLRQQHLTAVRAAAAVARAKVEGAELGSIALSFEPGGIAPGHHVFDVGTAGSTMLVLQTVLLPLMLARSPSQLTLVGGTHNPNAPPFEFIERAFLPVIGRMGAAVHVSLLRHGFYPAGGGRVEVAITPTDILRPMSLPSRGRAQTTEVAATVANLPATIADRELAVIRKGLDLPNVTYAVREVDAYCAGNFVTITMTHQQASEVFCGFGAKGVRAEEVARDALNQARRYLSRDAAVSEHLADQLLLPCALAGSGDFTTLTPTLHFATNCDVIKAFLDIDIVTYELAPDLYHVKIGSSRSPSA